MKDATLAQSIKLLTLIEQDGTPCEQVQDLLASGLFSDLIHANFKNGIDRNEFRRVLGLKPLNAFAVTVNYDRSVEDSVKAGKYDWSNDSITIKNFPSKRKGTADVEIILVKFEKDMESDDVMKQLDKQGLRPAELPELLAFGEKYPDVQRDFPVVALASVWQNPDGNRNVPYLNRDSDRRNLNLNWYDNRWNSIYRFAAVRNSLRFLAPGEVFFYEDDCRCQPPNCLPIS